MIDGKAVRPDGYQLGNVTGGIALKPNTYKVAFRREGVKEGETRVRVAANDTTILIPFAEQIPASEGQPARWEIRILKLKQHETENKRTATFVSVSREPELKVEIRQANGKWEPVSVNTPRHCPGRHPTGTRIPARALQQPAVVRDLGGRLRQLRRRPL